jgi:hypothetical protein
MDVKRFSGSPIGELVPITVSDIRFDVVMGHFAYVPAPLPEVIDLARGALQ